MLAAAPGARSDEVKESRMGRMGRLKPRVIALLVALLVAGTFATPLSAVHAQEAAPTPAAGSGSGPIRESLFQAILQDLPAAPALIRVVRIILQPGASVPMHAHTGPEFGRVENGILTVRVEGEAVVAQRSVGGTPQPAIVPPVGQEFNLVPGDQIVYPTGVPMSFWNDTADPVSVMTTVILPVGSGSPAGSEWVNGTPEANAMDGVTSQILGDAVAPGWPEPPFAVLLDRLVLAPGEPIPAQGGPVILALELGSFGFSLVDGQFQLSRGNSGPLAVATPGVPYILSPGDAVFFPGGMNEVPRPEADGVLVLVRLSVVNASGMLPEGETAIQNPADTATDGTTDPNAASDETTGGEPAGEPADIAPEAVPTEAAAEAAPDAEPAAEGAPPDTGSGATGVITENGLRLRASPSTTGDVVAELNEGREVIITGEAVEGDGIRWLPVQAADDPAVTGFIAEDFVQRP